MVAYTRGSLTWPMKTLILCWFMSLPRYWIRWEHYAKRRYALVFIDEDLHDAVVVLKLDLPPYHSIGAIFVPKVMDKTSLVMQTGIDLVCGPEGELCACSHNGWELLSGVDSTAEDGDFLVCWLDPEGGVTVSERTGEAPVLSPQPPLAHSSGSDCANPCEREVDPRQ